MHHRLTGSILGRDIGLLDVSSFANKAIYLSLYNRTIACNFFILHQQVTSVQF